MKNDMAKKAADNELYINVSKIWKLFDTNEGFRRAFVPLVRDAHRIIVLMSRMMALGCQPHLHYAYEEQYNSLMHGSVDGNGKKWLSFKDRAIRINDRNHGLVLGKTLHNVYDVLYLIEDLDGLYTEMRMEPLFEASLPGHRK